jgi:hypothetical protein
MKMNKFLVTVSIIFFAIISIISDSAIACNNESNHKKNSGDINTVNRLQGTLPVVQFDSNNVVLKFAAISDTHMQDSNGTPSKKLAAALDQLNTSANGFLDAVLISGDLTDYGLPKQVVELKRVFDNSKVDLTKTRFVFAIGNHEYYHSQLDGAAWTGGYLFRDVFGDEAYNGATDAEITAGDYHTIVNGYDFIVVNCVQYNGGIKYADSDINWLKTQLVQAAANHPGKPIFVSSHPNITGTNLGSNEGAYWNGSDLYSVFKDYPHIFFCGHLHFPEQDERSIWQGDFTTVSVGSTYYCSNHSTDDETGNTFIDITSGFETDDALKTSQGLFVEVDKNSNVRINRLDFANKEEIKKPWLIPSPKEDKSHLLYYTPAQEAETFGKTAPAFPTGAAFKELSKNYRLKQKYQFQFTQAIDSDMVYSYQVSFIDKATDTVIKEISTLSDFYLHAKPSEMSSPLVKTIYWADSILAPFGTAYKKEYYVKVVAVNCFGKKSEPIYSNSVTEVLNQEEQLPGSSLLFQNYPNPFNPSTIINYQIAKKSNVSLKVFNVLGREIASLVNEEKSAGSYSVNFNASSIPSGVYFYQIKSGSYLATKKMILLK